MHHVQGLGVFIVRLHLDGLEVTTSVWSVGEPGSSPCRVMSETAVHHARPAWLLSPLPPPWSGVVTNGSVAGVNLCMMYGW